MSARPENAGLRLSVVGSIQRIDLPGEQPVLANLPMKVLAFEPKSKRSVVMDPRPGRRGQVLGAVTDPEEPAGTLTILSISRKMAATMLMGTDAARAVAPQTVATPEQHRYAVGYAYQLDHENVGSVVVYPGVAAASTTGTEGSNNGITWTARTPGVGGNAITRALANPGANDAELAVGVTGTAIVVSLATGPTGTITSTAAEVIAAVNADAAAAALVVCAPTGASTGAAAVAAAVSAALAGGSNTGTALTEGTDYEVLHAREGQIRPLPGGAMGDDGDDGVCWTTYTTGAIGGYRIAAGQVPAMETRIVAAGQNDMMDSTGAVGSPVRVEMPRALLTRKGAIDLLKPEPLELEFEYVPMMPANGADACVLDFPQYEEPA